MKVETPVDRLLGFIQKKRKVPLSGACKKLGISKVDGEKWAHCLQKGGLIDIDYTKLGGAMVLKDKKEKKSVRKSGLMKISTEGKILAEYENTADNIPVKATIVKKEGEVVPLYIVNAPEFGEGTMAVLDRLVENIARNIRIDKADILDPQRMLSLRERFKQQAAKEVKAEFPAIPPKIKDQMVGKILYESYGLGDIELLMADPALEDIAVNGAGIPLSVYHSTHGWVKTNVCFHSDEITYNYAAQIGRKGGREINVLRPLLNANLVTGDRANATLFPISTKGNTITIRKFARTPWTITHFIGDFKTLSIDMAAFLWLAIQYEMNVLVAGGTASGKTSLINSLTVFIPPNQRLISIEDTREFILPEHLYWNWVPFVTRMPNPDGGGEVSMLELMVNALRMRPDRIVFGEVRRAREAEVLFEAMHTGHSILTTMHADRAENVLKRLLNPPFSMPPGDLAALQLIVVQSRDRRRNIRRTFEIAELIPASRRADEIRLELNMLHRWVARKDVFETLNESKRLFSEIAMFSGLTSQEIKKELTEKRSILAWLLKHKVTDVDLIGRLIGRYYDDAERFMEEVSSGKSPAQLMGKR